MGHIFKGSRLKRSVRVLWLGWLLLGTAACRQATPAGPSPAAASETKPGDLRADLTDEQRTRAMQGKALFNKQFTAAEGLGPHFNFASCGSCHDQPASGGHSDMAHKARLTFIDGDVDGLPQQDLPGFAPLQPRPGAPISFHRPPALFGLGLLESIDDAYLRDHCGVDKTLGIHGIANFNPGQQRVSRFGLKAHTATVRDFIGNALNLEMGITNPVERDARHFRDDDAVADPEVPTSTVDLLNSYVIALAAPAPPPANAAAEGLFATVGCATCHRPETAPGVRAFSDLCLHDMGPAFDNKLIDFRATGSHWRTTPLWGLRFRSKYFHDDRAADLGEAIAAHGGEASQARDRFAGLPAAEQTALLAWLRQL